MAMLPPVVQLQACDKEELQQLINRHSTPQQIALRARIIVLAGQGYNNQEIVRELNISRKWCACGVNGGYLPEGRTFVL